MFEAAVVVGEVEGAVCGEALHGAADEFAMVVLYVEDASGFFGVGEGRRVAEDEVVLAVAFGEPCHDVGALQAVAVGEVVEVEVALRPVEVGGREVDAGGVGGAAERGVDAGARGVAEEVQDAFAGGFRAEAFAHGAVVEEEAGVEVVVQVDEELCFAFLYLQVFFACVLFVVLVFAALPCAGFQDDVVGFDGQGLRDGLQDVEDALPCFAGIDGFGRRVFLDVGVLAVEVDGDGVFGQVLVIDAPGVGAAFFRVFASVRVVFREPVGKHLRAVA